MTDAIGPSAPSPHLPQMPATPNVPVLAKQMQDQVQIMVENLQKVLDDPSLSEQPSFLQKMAQDGSHLNLTVEQAFKLR